MIFHDTILTPKINELSGEGVYVNTDHKHFYLLPNANFKKLTNLTGLFTDIEIPVNKNRTITIVTPYQTELIVNLFTSYSPENFKIALTALFEELNNLNILGPKKRAGRKERQRALLIKLFIRLWAEGIILFPAGILSGKENCIDKIYANLNITNEQINSGSLYDVLKLLHDASYYDSSNTNIRVIKKLRSLLLCIGPISDLSEINKAILDSIIEIAPNDVRHLKYLYRGLEVLSDIQRCKFGRILLPYVEIVNNTETVKPEKKKITRSKDTDFAWFIERDETLMNWVKELSEYVENLLNFKNLGRFVTVFNKFLDYLLTNNEITRNPIEYIDNKYKDDDLIGYFDTLQTDTQQQYLSILRDFFENLLDKYATADDGEEGRYRLIGFSNPIQLDDIPTQDVRASHTHRIPMPRLLVEKAKEIITENDYKWCKTLKEDYFSWHNPESNMTTRVWSPVRALAILNKMTIPLRTYQVRMLDSGEGDPEVFDASTFKWVPNQGRHSNYFKKPSGFLRKIYDGEQCKHITGFFVNTNKTQDRKTLFIETGYEIPWEYEDLIRQTLYIRDFQMKYNQVDGPTSYSELTYENLTSKDVLDRLPDRFYLFRDPCAANKGTPVTDGRLSGFWQKLLRELQNRLNAERLSEEGGNEVILIEGTKPAFDLHSLRVTGLTALAQQGVPIEILSSIIAGHATLLMTIFYTKFGVRHITDTLNEAQRKLEEKAQEEFTDFLKNNPLKTLKKAVAFNSMDAIYLVATTQPAAWRFLDHGICVTGCTKCDEGGPAVVDHKDRKVHSPVPGGVMNCSMCRFFITGPPYLLGLVAKHNETVFLLDAASAEFRRHQSELQSLRREKIETEKAGEPFKRIRALRTAEGNLEESLERVDICSMTLHSLYNLTHQAYVILMAKDANDDSLSLICQGEKKDVEIHLVNCSKYDLHDEIVQGATVYKSINSTLPKLLRKDAFHRMLMRNGKDALLIHLDEETASRAINAANRFMYKRIGRQATNDLIDGKLMLNEIANGDFVNSIEKAIEHELQQPFKFAPTTIAYHQVSEPKQTLTYTEGINGTSISSS